MKQVANKQEAKDILEQIVSRNLTGFAGMTMREFADGIISNWGCNRPTANMVARMTGNW